MSWSDIGELPPVECTYADCIRRFATEAEMKIHKLNDPDHNYCKKCNVDCADWDALVQHKVEAMAPWLEGGSKRGNTEERPKHVVCEFCGEDFKSYGGRKIHREQMHPADQSVTCPGCLTIFTRGWRVIEHLEYGHCRKISQHHFVMSVQQRMIRKEMMKNPGEFAENVARNRAPSPPSPQAVPTLPNAPPGRPQGRITDGSEAIDNEAGGVSLLDCDDAEQSEGIPALYAASEHSRSSLTDDKSENQIWPHLPQRTPSVASSSEAKKASNIAEKMAIPKPPSAWRDGGSAKTLFRQSPVNTSGSSTPAAGDWNAIVRRREQEVIDTEQSNQSNLFRSRFYEPTSPDYKRSIFWNSVIDRYCCPFAGCGFQCDNDSDMDGHLRHAHLSFQFRCVACLKIFNTATGLVAHSESTTKCRVKDSKLYKEMLDEVSGGFLAAQRLEQPKIYRKETAALGMGKPMNGVASMRFKSQMPSMK